jgi:DNA-binding transcriptional LysR family regulator
MHMELPIDLLHTFSSVAETGSFTRAGELQHITQSAVSMQMKRLEEVVGQSLFRKKGRSFHLTPAGESLLEHALRILSAHNEAVAALSSPKLYGVIRFGCAEEYASRFLPTVLADFRKAFPRIRVEMISTASPELERMLQADDLDLCIIGGESEGGRIIHREPLVWVTARNGGAHLEEPLPLAVYQEGCVCRKWALDELRRADRPYWIAFVSASSYSILAAVRAGMAVAPISADTIDDSFRILGPENGFPLLPVSELRLHLSRGADSEIIDCFSNYIVEAFRQATDQKPQWAI